MSNVVQLDEARRRHPTPDNQTTSGVDPAPQLAAQIIELLASDMNYTLTEKLAALTLAARALTDTVSNAFSMSKARELAVKALRLADSYEVTGSRG